ncbi:MAG: acyl CoA:acetate/3-ketoacid CoA transferase, partial [Syntrophales bacterium LBB04]|nr:acyl CoA:acetate/3-ketoacid CoA transferase [Syntrophales bacterium LBB04]
MLSPEHPVKSDIFAKMRKGKVVSADEAVRVIRKGDTVAFSGFIGIGSSDEIILALEKRFVETGEPSGLNLIYASTLGDGKDSGLNHLAHDGLVKRIIAGHWGLTPKLVGLVNSNKIQAYNLPQGVISVMFRDRAAKRPRTITRVGLGTFVDPRIEGGKLNSATKEDIVELVSYDGQEYLAYKSFPVQVAVIRGTTADL